MARHCWGLLDTAPFDQPQHQRHHGHGRDNHHQDVAREILDAKMPHAFMRQVSDQPETTKSINLSSESHQKKQPLSFAENRSRRLFRLSLLKFDEACADYEVC